MAILKTHWNSPKPSKKKEEVYKIPERKVIFQKPVVEEEDYSEESVFDILNNFKDE